jgi:hypothetical protein
MTKNNSDKPAAEFQPNKTKDNVLLCSFSLTSKFWLNNKILGRTGRKSFARVGNGAKSPLSQVPYKTKWLKFCMPCHPQIDHGTISSSPLPPGFRIRIFFYGDPDPDLFCELNFKTDPRAFEPPGSRYISQRHGSGSCSGIRIRILLSLSKYNKKNLDFYCLVTSFRLFIFENDV